MEPIFLAVIKKDKDGKPDLKTISILAENCIAFCAMCVSVEKGEGGKAQLNIDMQTDIPMTEKEMHERILGMHAALIKQGQKAAGIYEDKGGFKAPTGIMRAPPNWRPPKFRGGNKHRLR